LIHLQTDVVDSHLQTDVDSEYSTEK